MLLIIVKLTDNQITANLQSNPMDTTQIYALLLEAATLMATGMIVVFAFLSVLIFSVKLLSKICHVLPQPLNEQASLTKPKLSTEQTLSDDTRVAIQAAVDAYRQGNVSRS